MQPIRQDVEKLHFELPGMDLPIRLSDCKKPTCYGPTIAGFLVLLVLAIVYSNKSNTGPACLPSTEVPAVTFANLLAQGESIVSARMAGYVELFDENETSYLPLDFHTISHEKLYEGPLAVSLLGDCVILDIKYTPIVGNDSKILRYAYRGIEMQLRNGRKSAKIPRKMCDFQAPFRFDLPVGQPFSCKQTRNHPCINLLASKHNKQRANLVLSRFELELDGDLEKDYKDAFVNTCDMWREVCGGTSVSNNSTNSRNTTTGKQA